MRDLGGHHDLYDEAAAEARRLAVPRQGVREAAHRRDLRIRGVSDDALAWRTAKGRIARLYRGAYLAGQAPLDVLERLAALRLVLPDEALVAHHTAAVLHGFGVLGSDLVHVLVPLNMTVPRIRGVVARQSVLPVPEPVEVMGFRCVPAARCAVDIARTVRRNDALPVLDAALRSGASNREDLVAELTRHDGLRGIRQARELVGFADERAQCRQESQLRLVLRDAGLPVPEPQVPVYDEYGWERFVVDLGYRKERVGVEYDGKSHLDRARLRADRRRHNWLESRGWAMRYFTDEDLYRRPDLIARTVRAALDAHSR